MASEAAQCNSNEMGSAMSRSPNGSGRAPVKNTTPASATGRRLPQASPTAGTELMPRHLLACAWAATLRPVASANARECLR